MQEHFHHSIFGHAVSKMGVVGRAAPSTMGLGYLEAWPVMLANRGVDEAISSVDIVSTSIVSYSTFYSVPFETLRIPQDHFLLTPKDFCTIAYRFTPVRLLQRSRPYRHQGSTTSSNPDPATKV